MAIKANHKNRFIALFNETARYHHRQRVFRDFITLAATSIHNGIRFDETLEQEYRETISHYEAKDADRMAQLLAEVVMGRSMDYNGCADVIMNVSSCCKSKFLVSI